MSYIQTIIAVPVTIGDQPCPGAIVTLRLQQPNVIVESTSVSAQPETIVVTGEDGIALVPVWPSAALYAVGHEGPVTYKLDVKYDRRTRLGPTAPFAVPIRAAGTPLTLAEVLELAGTPIEGGPHIPDPGSTAAIADVLDGLGVLSNSQHEPFKNSKGSYFTVEKYLTL